MQQIRDYAIPIVLLGVLVFFIGRTLYRPTTTVEVAGNSDDLEIVTLLPKDAIPSIDNPSFYPVEEANLEYAPDELVMGVEINGEKRAYSTGKLSNHEIVNDMVGGRPIAVTW